MSAALAYDRAVYALRGRTAKTNFPVTEVRMRLDRGGGRGWGVGGERGREGGREYIYDCEDKR